jgi:hypothetical protein
LQKTPLRRAPKKEELTASWKKKLIIKNFVALILAFEYRPIKYMRIIGAGHVANNGEGINTYRVSVGKT